MIVKLKSILSYSKETGFEVSTEVESICILSSNEINRTNSFHISNLDTVSLTMFEQCILSKYSFQFVLLNILIFIFKRQPLLKNISAK